MAKIRVVEHAHVFFLKRGAEWFDARSGRASASSNDVPAYRLRRTAERVAARANEREDSAAIIADALAPRGALRSEARAAALKALTAGGDESDAHAAANKVIEGASRAARFERMGERLAKPPRRWEPWAEAPESFRRSLAAILKRR